jgi:radical SAM/Cys-rich protein
MPIGRFRRFLTEKHQLERYMARLSNAFNPATLDGIMCRHLINVGWDGTLYDCDFNQMVNLPLLKNYPQMVQDFDRLLLVQREIACDDHCFGCTAGQGSSCKGAAA